MVYPFHHTQYMRLQFRLSFLHPMGYLPTRALSTSGSLKPRIHRIAINSTQYIQAILSLLCIRFVFSLIEVSIILLSIVVVAVIVVTVMSSAHLH